MVSTEFYAGLSPHKAVSQLEGIFKVMDFSCPRVASSIADHGPA